MKNIFFFLFFVSFSTPGVSQNVDIELLKEINLKGNQKLDPTFRLITNSVTPLNLAVPVGVITYALIKKDDKSKKNALVIPASILLSGMLTTGIKYTVNRERPFVTYPFIEEGNLENSPSFPSGHTTFAFALATSVSMAYPQWYVIAPSFLWAGAVGYSRMDFGLHYPSDVLAGAIVGSGSAYLCHKIHQKIEEKHREWSLSSSFVNEQLQLTLIIPLD